MITLIKRIVLATLVCGIITDPTFASDNRFTIQHTIFTLPAGGDWQDAVTVGSGSCSGSGCESRFSVTVDSTRYKLMLKYEVTKDPFDSVISIDPPSPLVGAEVHTRISDLQSTTVELLRSSKGDRVFVSVTPGIVTTEVKKPVLVTQGDFLETLQLDSVVLLNDKTYVGRLKMSGGPLIWFDILGVARIALSLAPFSDATEMGTLDNGTLLLKGPGNQTVEITNVGSGQEAHTILPGGPYKVYAKWTPSLPEEKDAYIRQIQKVLDSGTYRSEEIQQGLREKIREAQSDQPVIINNGVGPASIYDSIVGKK